MRTLRLTTYWTPAEAASVHQYLSELKDAIWQEYGGDIQKMYREIAKEQRRHNQENGFDNETF